MADLEVAIERRDRDALASVGINGPAVARTRIDDPRVARNLVTGWRAVIVSIPFVPILHMVAATTRRGLRDN